MEKGKTLHIHGTDLLRCGGMFMVLFMHVEWMKSVYGIPSFAKFYQSNQSIHGVMTLFFVISGLVITTVLLKEKQNTGTIDIKKFYIRRIQRIWPLYYIILAIVVAGYFFKWKILDTPLPGLREEDVPAVLIINILPLTNFYMFLPSKLEGFGHAWSLGTEQQFYLVWPWIVKKYTNLKRIFILIILSKIILKGAAWYLSRSTLLSAEAAGFVKHVDQFFVYFRVETLAVGGLLACVMFENNSKWIVPIQKKATQLVNLFVLLALLLIPVKIDAFHTLIAVCFSILIIGFNRPHKKNSGQSSRGLIYLSDLSYGIYMWQIPVLFILFNLTSSFYSKENMLAWNLSIYAVATLATVLAAFVSHELVEKRIYKKKV